MTTRLPPISKDSSLTFGFMFVILGGVVWLTTMFNQAAANAEAVKENKKKIIRIEEAQQQLIKMMNNQQLMMKENQLNIQYIKDSVQKIEKKVGR